MSPWRYFTCAPNHGLFVRRMVLLGGSVIVLSRMEKHGPCSSIFRHCTSIRVPSHDLERPDATNLLPFIGSLVGLRPEDVRDSQSFHSFSTSPIPVVAFFDSISAVILLGCIQIPRKPPEGGEGTLVSCVAWQRVTES